MNTLTGMIGRSPPRVAGRRCAWWVVAIPILGFVACRQGGLRPAARDGSPGSGGLVAGGSGGLGGTGGLYIILPGRGGAQGGAGGGGGTTVPDAGPVDVQVMLLPDGGCGSEFPLWNAVALAAGAIGYCRRLEGGSPEHGHVVVDGEGRVVHNSRFCNSQGSCNTERLRDWLATLEGYRWPCLAGQTISYFCVSE